jgi:Kef-type K+ transport system membrane component KefB
MLTPFFFIKSGTFISLPALLASLALIVALLAVKIIMKFIGVWPLTRVFRMSSREGNYTTLLMSTGLTFGSISALYGLTNGIIDQTQYTVLVTVVVGSAVVPTLIAQTWFLPEREHAGVAMPPETAGAPTQDREHLPGAPTIAPVGRAEEASVRRSQGDRAS